MPSQTDSPSSATRARPKRTRCAHEGCRKLAPPRRKRCDDHNPRLRPRDNRPATRKLYGRTEPRLWTRPLRPLTRKTTRGYEIIDFAEMIGEPLLPWQQWAVIHAFELKPDGSYRFRTVLILVARQNGKSHLKRVVSLWRMYMDGARRILGVAQDVALARDQWNMCQESIHDCPDLEEEWGRVRNVNGDEYFIASGCRYAIKAANRRAGRGGSNDEVNIDELREQTDWKAWAAVSKTTMARDNGQVWGMSNAGDDESVVLNQLRDTALAGHDDSLCILEWSAVYGCELDDRQAWAQANPGLGYIISESAIQSALSDPAEIFRTEVLCQRVRILNSAIDAAAWKDCADPAGTMDGLRDRVGACLDVAPDGQHVTLNVAAKLRTGQVRVEVAGAWKTTDQARAELPMLLARIKPLALGWYPSGPAARLAPVLRPLAAKYNPKRPKPRPGIPAPWLPENGEIAGLKVSEACQAMADLVTGRQVLHPADPLLDAHTEGASKQPSGDGWRFVRRIGGEEAHCDAAYAAAGAIQIALTMPEPKRARIRIIS